MMYFWIYCLIILGLKGFASLYSHLEIKDVKGNVKVYNRIIFVVLSYCLGIVQLMRMLLKPCILNILHFKRLLLQVFCLEYDKDLLLLPRDMDHVVSCNLKLFQIHGQDLWKKTNNQN